MEIKYWPIYLLLILLGMQIQEYGIMAVIFGLGTVALFGWLLYVVSDFIDNKKWKNF